MQTLIYSRSATDYPPMFNRLKKPPEQLFCKGRELADIMSRPRVAVVGTRTISPYGRQVTRDIVKRLAEQGVVIVSGLAYGVDAEAHQAALDAGGITVAVLPSPVETPTPVGNARLADHILKQGGALLSTYTDNAENHKGNFVQRNEYVAALSQAVIVTEAGQRSGSRHTAVFAEDLGVPVFAVPGPITSPTSAGTNAMIHSNLAQLFLNIKDISEKLSLGRQLTLASVRGDTPAEQAILDSMAQGVSDGHQLFTSSHLDIVEYNRTLTMLEISGKIRPLGGNQWSLA